MLRPRWLFPCLLLLCLLVPVGPAPAGDDNAELIQRIRHALKIPPSYQVRLGPAEKTDIAGLVKRTLEVTGGSQPRSDTIFVSEDGRYLFWGRLYDLDAQPGPNRFQHIPVAGHPALGPADARVTIIEYADFQCPFCERAYWMVKYKLLPRYSGQVRLIFKDFPLTRSHAWALKAAVAAQCAFQQGNDAFWKLHDLLFECQDELNAENLDARLSELAVAGGFDLPAFRKCYDSQATLPRVQASIAEAEGLGLTGTPAFVINGQLLSGAVPFPRFKAVLDRELAAAQPHAAPPVP